MRRMPAPSPPRRRWRLRSATRCAIRTLARNSAVAAAQQNLVWGEAPDILGTDVTFPTVRRGASGRGPASGRMSSAPRYGRAGGNPLPTFFANIVGIGEQGTGPRRRRRCWPASGTADCVKPWAIPDRWNENHTRLGSDRHVCPLRAGRTWRRHPPPAATRCLPGAERGRHRNRLPLADRLRHPAARSRWASTGDFARADRYLPGE